MSWFRRLFGNAGESKEENEKEKQNETEKEETSTAAVRMYERGGDGSLREHRGDASDVHALMLLAQTPYQSVMAAARANSITSAHERQIHEAIDLLTKVIQIDGTRGEPYGQRGAMHFIDGQMRRDRSSLDKAEQDYLKALEVGASDPSNDSVWRETLGQIALVKGMI